jgi:lipid-A-disaccharide synthase
MKIFLIAGEESGDILGADLMAALNVSGAADISFSGIGGRRMEEEGIKSLFSMDELSLMGIAEIAPKVPELLKRIQETVEEIEAIQPDVVITIDAPDFCFRVAKRLRKRGKIRPHLIHYVAPTVWAWRPGRAKRLAETYDAVLCLFPFEPSYFEREGMEAVFTGHPMTRIYEGADRETFRKDLHIPTDATAIGILMGSRVAEIEKMGAVLVEAAERLVEAGVTKPYFILPTLPAFARRVRAMMEHISHPTIIITDHQEKKDALAACDVAMATSGTVGLELAYLGVPHVIGYQMNKWTYEILKRVVTTKYIHLANIVLDKPVVPELIQHHCTAEEFSERVLRLLDDSMQRDAQLEAFEEVREKISSNQGGKWPAEVAADYILQKLGEA